MAPSPLHNFRIKLLHLSGSWLLILREEGEENAGEATAAGPPLQGASHSHPPLQLSTGAAGTRRASFTPGLAAVHEQWSKPRWLRGLPTGSVISTCYS